MKKYYLIIPVFIFLLFSCINEDFENTFSKTIFKPEYSIALGVTEYILETKEFTGPGSTEQGDYGYIYYNDTRYELDSLYFTRNETKIFNINSAKTVRKNIESLTIHVLAINSFPTDVQTSIYFYDSDSTLLFSAFPNGPLIISGGKTDNSGRVIENNSQIIEVTLTPQQVDQLGSIVEYRIHSLIMTKKPGIETVKFYSTENMSLTVGVRVKLNIAVDEL